MIKNRKKKSCNISLLNIEMYLNIQVECQLVKETNKRHCLNL